MQDNKMQDNKTQDNKIQDNTMQDNTMQDNTMQGNLNGFETVWISGKWEMTWKNPDSFETIRKIGNHPEKSEQF